MSLIFGEVPHHQIQCSIFANQQLKVSNVFLCSCYFRPTATWLSFRSDPHSSARLQIAFTEQSFQPFYEIFLQQLFGIQNQVSATCYQAPG